MNRIIPVILLLFFAACINNNQPNNRQADTSTTDTVMTARAISEEYPQETEAFTIEPTDTISIGKYLLYFEPTDSIAFPPNYQHQEIRDSIWRVLTNSHDAANAVENYLKNKHPHIFTSNDTILTIQLGDGKKITFPKGDEVEMRGFCFEGYFPAIDYVLLYVQYYEGNAWMLVNRKNGFKRQIHGKPYFSENNKSFITANVDLEANYSFNGIEYYILTADSVMQQFEMGINNWGPAKAKWISENRIVLAQDFMVANPDTYYYKTDYTKLTFANK